MSDIALFLPPLLKGYSETIKLQRQFHEFDHGAFEHYPVQDFNNGISEWGKYMVNATYKVIGIRDSSTFEQLIIKGARDSLWVPLWASRMQLNGAHSSGVSTFTVKDSTGLGNTLLDYTEFDGDKWGYSNNRPNVKIFLSKVSVPYTWELLTINALSSTTQITSTTNSTNSYADEDWIVPAIQCKLKSKNPYRNHRGIITDVSLGMEEL